MPPSPLSSQRPSPGSRRLIESILGAGGFASESGGLDVAKLYAAVSSRFPEGWAAEEAVVAPEGTATVEDLKAWAKATFGYGTAALPGAVDLALLAKSADTAQEIEIDPETALGLYQACAQLIPFTVEAQQAAVAAEADS
jgi:hypothetical protein